MRTTLTTDDELLSRAQALAEPGIDKVELLDQCVKAFIDRQVSRRLAALGGGIPEMVLAKRRR